MHNIDLELLFLALSIIVLRTVRFRLLLPSIEEVSFLKLSSLQSLSIFINSLIPLRIGDLLRLIVLRAWGKGNLSSSTIFSAIFYELFYDLLFLVLFLFTWGYLKHQRYEILLYAVDLIGIVLFLVFLYYIVGKFKSVRDILIGLSNIFNDNISFRIKRLFWTLHQGYPAGKILTIRFSCLTAAIWCVLLLFYSKLSNYNGFSHDLIDLIQLFHSEFFRFEISAIAGEFALTFHQRTVYSICMIIIMLSYIIINGTKRYHNGKFSNAGSSLVVRWFRFHQSPTKFSNQKAQAKYIDKWFESGRTVVTGLDNTIVDFFSGGSGATIVLMEKNDSLFVRKEARAGTIAAKLKDQIRWYNSCAKSRIPKVYQEVNADDVYYYDMEFVPNSVSMSEGLANLKEPAVINLLDTVYHDFCIPQKLNDQKICREAFNEYISTKFLKNLDYLRSELDKLLKLNVLILNSENISLQCLRVLRNHVENVTAMSYLTEEIHGDLTFENIMINPKGELTYIDPNPTKFNFNFVDAAKLLQSANLGYEFLLNRKAIETDMGYEIDFSKNTKYDLANQYLEKRLQTEGPNAFYLAKFHEIIHYLRLLPYRDTEDSKRLFCLCTLKLCHDFVRRFRC